MKLEITEVLGSSVVPDQEAELPPAEHSSPR